MRFVVSHEQLVGFGGTESYMLTVAQGLQRLGHEAVLHVLRAGPAAAAAEERGIRVETDAARLPAGCDAVLAQDAATAYALGGRYPDAAQVFVAHSSGFPVQSPPQVEGACDAVVVMNDRLARRTRGLAGRPPVVRLRQPINLQRFCFQPLRLEQRRRPRALLLSNYTSGARARMVEEACSAAGVELRRVGAMTTPTAAPEHEIAASEIVLTLGRGALEAMACGRAAYVFGDAGGDGWVTPDAYPALEADGFSGRALGEAIGIERMTADLAGWRQELGELGRDLACEHHAVDDHCLSLIELVESLDPARPRAGAEVAGELSRLVRLEWNQSQDTRLAIGELEKARARAVELEAEVAARRGEAERAALELELLRRTRRYRFAALLARPLDLYRAGRARSRV